MELIYARWLAWGTRVSLALLVGCFFVYVLGFAEPLVPVHELARLWTLPVGEYIAASGAPLGWRWLGYLGKGDYLNLVGIALLCLITVPCYARIVPLLLKSDRLLATLAILQILVLLTAASGLLSGHG